MGEKKINAGAVIFNEGETADAAYTVSSGTVELSYTSSGAETRIGVVEAGKVFGELAIFSNRELRPYTARAVSECVLETITYEEFQALLSKCPETVKSFLALAFEKLAPVKTKSKIPAIVLSKSDITKITISPATEELKTQLKPIDVPVNTLPFRIGGYPLDGERSRRDPLHLAIASQKNPLIVSHQHCEITFDNNGNIIVGDLGSRFGTTVNGLDIGRGRGAYHAPLKKGKNDIALGGRDSKYKLMLNCS